MGGICSCTDKKRPEKKCFHHESTSYESDTEEAEDLEKNRTRTKMQAHTKNRESKLRGLQGEISRSLSSLFPKKLLKNNIVLNEKPPSQVPTFMDRIRDHSLNPHDDEFVQGELMAKSYMDSVEDNTIAQLDNTLMVANSIVEKGDNIIEELERQREVTRKANQDIHATEQEIHETTYILRGMQSMGGKLTNLIWKKPLDKACETLGCGNKKESHRTKAMSLPIPQSSYKSAETKQERISEGVNQLNTAMDMIQKRQMDIRSEIEQQEEDMAEFSGNMDRMEMNILGQTQLMHHIATL